MKKGLDRDETFSYRRQQAYYNLADCRLLSSVHQMAEVINSFRIQLMRRFVLYTLL